MAATRKSTQAIQYSILNVPLSELLRNPDNARAVRNEVKMLEMAEDLKSNGQIYPVIGFYVGEPSSPSTSESPCGDAIETWRKIMLVDGHLRFEGAQLAGLEKLMVLVCDREPTRAEVLMLQARIDLHRQNFNAVEQSDLLAKIQAEIGCGLGELASLINKKQPMVTKLLTLQGASDEVRKLILCGDLDVERAYMIVSATKDAAQQLELVKSAKGVSREQLRQRLHGAAEKQVKTASATFTMPGGLSVLLRGQQLTLVTAIEVLAETVRILKKGLGQGFDIATQMRVMKDQSRRTPKSPSK